MAMNELKKTFECECGKTHDGLIDEYIIEKNAISKVPYYVKRYGAEKAYIISDTNTYKCAGEMVIEALKEGGIKYCNYTFKDERVSPDEFSVGSAIMHFDKSCDIVIGVGSGVINDISKIVANVAKLNYIVVATAPSMDGYASASSSVDIDGLKVSLPSKCANVVIGDIDILKNAPERMLISGLGDMLAKYISVCEWKISNLITGEYYCETIAQIIREALKNCVDNAKGLLKRDEAAIKAVFEGLVLGGMAMNYAGLSRPASGVEHYFSHVWDMRGLEFDTKVDFHGIQCAIGTLYAAKIYDKIRNITPDREKALDYVNKFNYSDYKDKLIAFIGKGANEMIMLEEKEQKYSVEKHTKRLENIIDRWQDILNIISEEIPSAEEIERILDLINCPKRASDIGIDEDIVPMTFFATKDIRDKYALSRLCWDLGIINDWGEF